MAVKFLPRPLPASVANICLPKKTKGDEEEEKKDEGSVEDLSPQELLWRHVRRAKRVWARLREQWLQRIAWYRRRLALLILPSVE